MPDFDRRLAAVALRQHAVITLDDVRAAGGSNRHVTARIAAGRWIAVHDRVYRLAGAPWTYEGRVFAALCAAGAGAFASHKCAARLLGFGFVRADVEISVPRGRRPRLRGVIVHTSTDLDRCRVMKRKGITVTDPARTLLDLARYLRPAALARAVEQARRLELVTWHDLIVCLAAHARQGRHGVRRLRELVAVGAPNEEVTDTDSELIAVTVLNEHGFPAPVLHHRVFDDDGRLVAELDLGYLDVRVDFEIDGDVHLDPEQRIRDDARDAELRERFDWTIRRIWWEIPVREPEKFLRIVRQTLRAAGHPAFL